MYVTCEIGGKKIEDARLSIDEDGRVYICQNEMSGSKGDELFGYTYSWFFAYKGGYYEDWSDVKNIHSVEEKALDNLEVGDVLANDDGYSLTIEGLSYYGTNQGYFSAGYLKRIGYKIVTTLTKKEAEKKLGVKIID